MFERLASWPKYAMLVEDLVGNWKEIRQEAQEAKEQLVYTKWHERHLHNDAWSVLGIYWQGRIVQDSYSKAPITAKILSNWLPVVCNAGFSLLEPGAYIKPHEGYTTEVLRLHLGLDVPTGDCAIQVGDVISKWANGEVIIFDDTQVHSAWNKSQEDRVILIVDLIK